MQAKRIFKNALHTYYYLYEYMNLYVVLPNVTTSVSYGIAMVSLYHHSTSMCFLFCVSVTFISEEIVYLDKALSFSLLSAMLHSGAAECVLGYSFSPVCVSLCSVR